MLICMQTVRLLFFVSVLLFCTGCSKEETPRLDYKKHIEEHLSILEKDPDNCLAIDQVGASYQMLYDERNAIKYYEILIDRCPGGYWEIEGHWKIGLSYIVMGQSERGLELLDKAIEMARRSENKELYDGYLLEKEILMEKYLK